MNVPATALKGTMADLSAGASVVHNQVAAKFDHGKRIATLDDKMAGNMLALEVMATAQTQGQVWRRFAMRVIESNIEQRAAFIDAIDRGLKELREQNKLGDLVDAKVAKKRVAVATVEVSKLRTVASAFNGGATVEGLVQYVASATKTQSVELDNIGYTMIVEYARTFSTSKAGRKADTLLVKFGKWLEAQAKVGIAESDMVIYNQLVEVNNNLAG